MLTPQEAVFLTICGCFALLGLLVASWGTLLIGTAAHAWMRGHNVKQAIQPLLDEL